MLPPGHGAAPMASTPRAALGAGDGFAGPAIVTPPDATTLVAEGWRIRMDASDALILEQ
jgi:N-methylhydantoinase A